MRQHCTSIEYAWITQDENLKHSWDEYISYLYASAFMNNSRYDNHDRKKLFNFQFSRYQEPTKKVYLSKYDYSKLPEGWNDSQEELEDRDVVSNPDDDISEDSRDFPKKQAKRELVNAADMKELEELDDLLGDLDPEQSSPKPKHLHSAAMRDADIDDQLDDIDPSMFSAPVKRTAATAQQSDMNITSADLDELMDEYLQFKDAA